MTRLRNHSPSRDEWRSLQREARREGRDSRVSVSLRPSSRKRLNWLRKVLKVDDQGMVIDVLCIRLTGSLTLWEDADA
jgi:hypothetical protein